MALLRGCDSDFMWEYAEGIKFLVISDPSAHQLEAHFPYVGDCLGKDSDAYLTMKKGWLIVVAFSSFVLLNQ